RPRPVGPVAQGPPRPDRRRFLPPPRVADLPRVVHYPLQLRDPRLRRRLFVRRRPECPQLAACVVQERQQLIGDMRKVGQVGRPGERLGLLLVLETDRGGLRRVLITREALAARAAAAARRERNREQQWGCPPHAKYRTGFHGRRTPPGQRRGAAEASTARRPLPRSSLRPARDRA